MIPRPLTAEYHTAELELRRVAQRCEGVHAEFFAGIADQIRARFEVMDMAPQISPAAGVMPQQRTAAAARDENAASTDGAGDADTRAPACAPAPSRAFDRSEAIHRMADLIAREVDGYAPAGSQRNEMARRFILEARKLANRWQEDPQMLKHARGKLDAARNVLVTR